MNLLVTGAFNCTQEQLNRIYEIGNNVLFHKMECENLPCSYDWVEGVICNGLFLHHPIEKFCNLKYIQLTSAGYDRVDMDYVKEHNIKIFNARGVYSIPMAEFAVCGVLDLYKQSSFFYDNQKLHKWDKHRGLLELYGKTVCIVGSGNVGTECAKRFKAFNTTVYAVDICKPQSDIYDKYFSLENITDAISQSDVIILTLPLTEQTKYMFDKKMFLHFKSNAILVNIARGAIVNQDDLIYALNSKQLYGAVLDVFETEPLDTDSPLWDMPNVIITPHNSFVGEGNMQRLTNIILYNLEMYNR
ncbi:MAG: hydroxyacid dehydrogenase [Ruminococcaceae bacterium]|nr:hydroxyacid dehydrogenase [Oscillospiraceae bacterium]